MNFPEYWNSVWTDPQFQALDEKTRLFFFAAASQVDIAGWWYPHPQLTPLQISGLNPSKAAADLSPWVQTHPSGYLSLKGYVAIQAPKGLNTTSGFHRGIHKRLLMHQARERKTGGALESIEGLESQAGSTSSGVDVAGAVEVGSPLTQARGTVDPQSSKSKVPSSKSKVQSPTRESEGDAVPQPALDGQTRDVAPLPDRPKLDDLESVWAAFRMYRVDVYNPAPWMVGILNEAAKDKGWRRVTEAAVKYLSCPDSGPGRSLETFVKAIGPWMRRNCQHPQDDLVWWTVALDPRWPNFGPKAKRCRCPHCGHVETREDAQWIPDHEHSYVDQDGPGFVLGDQGLMVKVPYWQECKLCGHQQAAARKAVAP